MPCNNGGYDPSPDAVVMPLINYVREKMGLEFVRTNINGEGLVAILCSLVKSLNPQQFDEIVYNARDPMSRKLADWWESHEEMDRREAEVKERARRRLALIEKMTAEERDLLGFSHEYEAHCKKEQQPIIVEEGKAKLLDKRRRLG